MLSPDVEPRFSAPIFSLGSWDFQTGFSDDSGCAFSGHSGCPAQSIVGLASPSDLETILPVHYAFSDHPGLRDVETILPFSESAIGAGTSDFQSAF